MTDKKEAAKKRAADNLAKDPDYYKKLGSKSWKNERDHKTGFALLPKARRIALGRKGGKRKRNKGEQ